MAVRVTVRLSALKGRGHRAETSAVANSGYEAGEPEIVLPERLAEKLFPGVHGRLVEYVTVLGRSKLRRISRAVNVSLLVEEREEGPVTASAVVSPMEDEVLLSDSLMEELKLVPEKPGRGLWRFADEPPRRLRRSSPPERW